ncbi:hypothetical protein CCHL11_02135 [Colletotrichum chlorophyti]|uniref:Uncharacterized protein n=1 Tax=Colletotrichum chlorophyti TaxID=708187 RepID=A0A1Q8S6U9_9PEZI|nr:hypothetical protein CCHL11_02135 [Colletotrichum chlorophyti]
MDLGHESTGCGAQISSGVLTVAVEGYVVIPENLRYGQLNLQPLFPLSYGGGWIPVRGDVGAPSDIFPTGWEAITRSGF